MNTYEVKKNLGFFYCCKLFACAMMVFFSYRNGNSLFQGIVMAMYLLSVLSLFVVAYRKIHSVLATFIVFLVCFILFIKLPVPRLVISIAMLFMMFFGAVYDCFQWVRLAEIKYDERHGNKEKWLELERMVNVTKHYSDQEKRVSFMASVSAQKHKEGNELAIKMGGYITASEEIWNTLPQNVNGAALSELRREYDSIISESADIRKYFEFADCYSSDPGVESQKYETMREYFNRFQRVRKRLAEFQKNIGNDVSTSTVSGMTNYFNGCNSLESLQKRYKDLCKVYHPDMGNGSAEIFAEIQATYEELRKKYK